MALNCQLDNQAVIFGRVSENLSLLIKELTDSYFSTYSTDLNTL